jgi:hypothetical protein
MEYNNAGQPTIRTTVDGINLQGNVLVSNVTIDSGNIIVWQGTDPWVITGNANVSVIGNVSGITTLPAITGNVGVSGNVSITQLPGIAITSLPEVEIKNDAGNPIPISANTSPNSSSNRIYVSGLTDITVADSTYEMNVARGLVGSQYAEFKNGYAGSLSQGVEASIWSQNTLYPWASWTTAQRLYVVSSSAADTGQTIYIDGLASDYSRQNEIVTTNGTTAVASVKSYLRINHMYIIDGSPNAGTITTRIGSASGTIVGGMNIGFSRNRQAPFTVPLGWTAYILYGDATQFRGGSGNIGGTVRMYTRTPNNGNPPFMLAFIAEVVNGVYRNDFKVPFAIPQKTDIDVRIVPDGNSTEATCNYQMIMIPN